MVVETQAVTLNYLVSRFVRRRHLAKSTRDYYATMLNNFQWYARSNQWPEPEGITRAHLQDFLDYVATETYRWPESERVSFRAASTATVHHYGTVVKGVFNWAEEEGYLHNNPARGIRLGSPGYKEVDPYSDDEVFAMLAVCDEDARFRYRYLGLRNKAIISLFIATGLRVEELSNIELDHLDPKLNEIWVMGKDPSPGWCP